MGGASLTGTKIEKMLKKEIFNAPNFSMKAQFTLDNFGIPIDSLGLPETSVEKIGRSASFTHYKAKMSTETIKEPIYIYQDGYTEYVKGYQKIETFEFWIMEDFTNLYIFAPKQVADTFIHRLTKERYITCATLHFDFSKIKELQNLDSAWGTWEDSEGVVRRIARFGKGIESEIKNWSKITTLYIDYNYGNKLIQIILGVNGNISTYGNIRNRDLFTIYDEICKVLF